MLFRIIYEIWFFRYGFGSVVKNINRMFFWFKDFIVRGFWIIKDLWLFLLNIVIGRIWLEKVIKVYIGL